MRLHVEASCHDHIILVLPRLLMFLLCSCTLEECIAGGVTVSESRCILVECVELAQINYLRVAFLSILVIIELTAVFRE